MPCHGLIRKGPTCADCNRGKSTINEKPDFQFQWDTAKVPLTTNCSGTLPVCNCPKKKVALPAKKIEETKKVWAQVVPKPLVVSKKQLEEEARDKQLYIELSIGPVSYYKPVTRDDFEPSVSDRQFLRNHNFKEGYKDIMLHTMKEIKKRIAQKKYGSK